MPSLGADKVGVPQASVAVAVPSAPLILSTDGLQPNIVVVPPEIIIGGVLSTVHVISCVHEDIFPHSSVAVHVRFMLLPQAVLVTGPSAATGIIIPLQLSVAVPPTKLGPGIVGLHPCKFSVGGQVRTGAVLSKHGFIWKGEMKSFRSAVLSAEDFVLINNDLKEAYRTQGNLYLR